MAVWSQPLLSVRDVPASSRWYQQVLDAVSGHGGEDFEQLLVGGEIVLQLHRIDVADHHGLLADSQVPLGNGVAVWFEVSDFAAAVARIRTAGVRVETEPHENPNARQHEIWLTDPDGYRVVVAGPSAYRPRS
ncbi:MAG TPA: VOC family protein [Mycobacteriales bacterium]|nr:VOC family protein [Mycobacteriales bacterium]